jgi:hypothetical protein
VKIKHLCDFIETYLCLKTEFKITVHGNKRSIEIRVSEKAQMTVILLADTLDEVLLLLVEAPGSSMDFITKHKEGC